MEIKAKIINEINKLVEHVDADEYNKLDIGFADLEKGILHYTFVKDNKLYMVKVSRNRGEDGYTYNDKDAKKIDLNNIKLEDLFDIYLGLRDNQDIVYRYEKIKGELSKKINNLIPKNNAIDGVKEEDIISLLRIFGELNQYLSTLDKNKVKKEFKKIMKETIRNKGKFSLLRGGKGG